MAERLIIVGGDAAGMSAASQARRRRGPDDLEILAFERSSFVSYSACGEPYYVGGYIPDISQLQARTPEEFKAMDIDVRTCHEVIAIAPREGKVTVRALPQGTEETYGYDLLVYATGAAPSYRPSPDWTWQACTSCARSTTRWQCVAWSSPGCGTPWWSGVGTSAWR